jgi:hypothetical protein
LIFKLVFNLLKSDFPGLEINKTDRVTISGPVVQSLKGIVKIAVFVVAFVAELIPIRTLERVFPFSVVLQSVRVLIRIELAGQKFERPNHV